jgi:UDP:flavonoid glycosyltransferase YjiC (YdhE family)
MSGAAARAGRRKVLFFAEAVTLAHAARPAVLAGQLPASEFEVHLAQSPRYRGLFGDLPVTEHSIESLSPERFLAALANGSPLYDEDTLHRYVREDLRLIEQVAPDILVGDFRLSLAVSARLANIPYIAISNAYWSPYCRQRYTVPELPFVRLLGPVLGQALFSMVRPAAFARHCLPMRRLRRHHGMPPGGFDLRRVYTDADITLYADVPQMYDMRALPGSHRFIGPVNWSPRVPLPGWWKDIPRNGSLVYVTLGSSGQSQSLPAVLEALGRLDVVAMVATAGAPAPARTPANVYLADYLPGEDACAVADLVICNGGSPTAHQALARGVPVLGLAGNLDQFLNMTAVAGAGAGRLLRAGSADAGEVAHAVSGMLGDPGCRAAATGVAKWFSEYSSSQIFYRTIKEIDVS